MKKLLFLSSIVIFASCSTGDDMDDVNYSQYIISDSIDTDVKFMPNEVHDLQTVPNPPNLVLSFETEKSYACYNYSLITTEFFEDNQLIIRFESVEIPEICLTAIGPARKQIELPETTETLVLINGNKIDRYSIEITSSEINIKPLDINFTESLYEKTFRFPENSFALVCGSNINNGFLCEDISNLIEGNSLFTEFEFPPNGRLPYPEYSSGNWNNLASKFFRYSNVQDYEILEQLLQNFTSEEIEPNSGVSISLIFWNGLSYSSYQYLD